MFAVLGGLLGFVAGAAGFVRNRTWRIGYDNMSSGELWTEASMVFAMSLLIGCTGAIIGWVFEQSPAAVFVSFIGLAVAAGVVAVIKRILGRLENG